MVVVKYIHTEGNKEIHETLNMSKYEKGNDADRIIIRKSPFSEPVFEVTEQDFEELFQRKLKESEKNEKTS